MVPHPFVLKIRSHAVFPPGEISELRRSHRNSSSGFFVHFLNKRLEVVVWTNVKKSEFLEGNVRCLPMPKSVFKKECRRRLAQPDMTIDVNGPFLTLSKLPANKDSANNDGQRPCTAVPGASCRARASSVIPNVNARAKTSVLFKSHVCKERNWRLGASWRDCTTRSSETFPVVAADGTKRRAETSIDVIATFSVFK